MRPILSVVLLMLTAGAATANAEDRSSSGEWEDPTCKEVWRAVIMTEIYPSFTADISLVNEAGVSRPFMRREFSPTESREKRPFEKKWRTFERLGVEETAWDRFEPRITNCIRLGAVKSPRGKENRWRMTWSGFPYKAEMDAWISTEHQLVTKIARRYLSQWAYPEERVSIAYHYNDLPRFAAFKKARSPEGQDACVRVREMMANYNSVGASQLTFQFIDNGSGEPSLRHVVTVRTLAYSREAGGAWHLDTRVTGKPEEASNCRLLGHQKVNDVRTSVFLYERPEGPNGGDRRFRIKMWISDQTNLPVRSHFERLFPDNGEEYYVSYSFDPGVKEPY